MKALRIRTVELAGTPGMPLLLVGPSLGTSVTALWAAAAHLLGASTHVVGWDLPGHGHSPPPDAPFTIGDLATAIGHLCDDDFAGTNFAYAGVSVAGAVGLHMLLAQPDRITAAALICTGARIGDAEAWHARAAQVRTEGTSALAAGSAKRWFAPGFTDRQPNVAAELLQSLSEAHPTGYAATCEALAAFKRPRSPARDHHPGARHRRSRRHRHPVGIASRNQRPDVGRTVRRTPPHGPPGPGRDPRRTAELIQAMIEGTHS